MSPLTVRPWKVRRPQNRENPSSSKNIIFQKRDLLNFQAVSDQLSLQLLAIIFSCVALVSDEEFMKRNTMSPT